VASRAAAGRNPTESGVLIPRVTVGLRRLAWGGSNAGITRELYLGEATVKTQVTHIPSRLGLTGRTQAAVLDYETRLMTPS